MPRFFESEFHMLRDKSLKSLSIYTVHTNEHSRQLFQLPLSCFVPCHKVMFSESCQCQSCNFPLNQNDKQRPPKRHPYFMSNAASLSSLKSRSEAKEHISCRRLVIWRHSSRQIHSGSLEKASAQFIYHWQLRTTSWCSLCNVLRKQIQQTHWSALLEPESIFKWALTYLDVMQIRCVAFPSISFTDKDKNVRRQDQANPVNRKRGENPLVWKCCSRCSKNSPKQQMKTECPLCCQKEFCVKLDAMLCMYSESAETIPPIVLPPSTPFEDRMVFVAAGLSISPQKQRSHTSATSSVFGNDALARQNTSLCPAGTNEQHH